MLKLFIIVSFKNKTSIDIIELNIKKRKGIKKPKITGKEQKEIINALFNLSEVIKFIFLVIDIFKLILSLEKSFFCKNKIRKIKNKKKIDICEAKFISPKPTQVL